MPTKEEILNLSKEEKEELLILLQSEKDAAKDDNVIVEPHEEEIKNETEETKKDEENKLDGGLADKLSLEDIAKKHNVTIDVIESELEKGIKVEMEHTDDPEKAKEIALDHLSEQSNYYEKLKEVENNQQTVDFEKKIDDVIKSFDNKIETLIETFSKKLDEKDKAISELNEKLEEEKRVRPTNVANPIITDSSLKTPQEAERQKSNNSWTKSPSTVYQSIK